MATPTPPIVYVLAGPNGAGKTTFANIFLPGFVNCREFLNADLIAAGLSPFNPAPQNAYAGKLLLERMAQLSQARATFAFETTLSGRSYLRILRDLQFRGYRVLLFFFWLPSADMAVHRVANRVRQGGHGIAEHDIRRRYDAGIKNFFELYLALANESWLYDTSRMHPQLIGSYANKTWTALDPVMFQSVRKSLE
jgi:predicted ABC-type ATPase